MGKWTPLLLAGAISDFKRRAGGEAHLVAVTPEYIEMSQGKCEYGEPREGEYRGNMCDVCMSVTGAVAWASGIADPEVFHEFACTIAQGYKSCDFRIALT